MRERNETRLGRPPPPSGSFARGRLFTYESQDTSCFLHLQVCTFVSVHMSVRVCMSMFPLHWKPRFFGNTDSVLWGGGMGIYRKGGNGEAMFSPNACPASPQNAAGLLQQWLHDIPALAVVLREELYLWPGPWFSAFPGGPTPVWGQ